MNQNQYNQNRLLAGYQQRQQENFLNNNNNNAFIVNNPLFNQNNMSHMSKSQMQELCQHIQKIKQLQEFKQIEKMNEVDKKYDKKKIREAIIPTIKEQKGNVNELNKKTVEKTENFGTERELLWKQRTNSPYKNILKDEDYKKEFNKKDDLIIHKVTNADKIGIEEKFIGLIESLEKHNNELKLIYSFSKHNEHIKDFEYNHAYKFRIKHTPSDHSDLKQDNLDYYKDEQKKLEKDKQKVDEIIESLVSIGVLDEEEIKKIENNEAVEVDLEKIELNLKNKLGPAYDKIREQIKKQNNSSENLESIQIVKHDASSKIKTNIIKESIVRPVNSIKEPIVNTPKGIKEPVNKTVVNKLAVKPKMNVREAVDKQNTGIPSVVPKSIPSIAPKSIPSVAPKSIPSIAPKSIPSIAPKSTPSIASKGIKEPSVKKDIKEPAVKQNIKIAGTKGVKSVGKK